MTDHWHPGDEPPKCKDCRFANTGYVPGHCLHYELIELASDEISDDSLRVVPELGEARSKHGKCGPEARLFEEKPQ